MYRFALFSPLLFAAALVAGLTGQPDHSLLADPLGQLMARSQQDGGIAAMGLALASLLQAGLGIAMARDRQGPGRMAGALIAGLGLAGLLNALVFPMDLPGAETTIAGAAHFGLSGLSALCTLTAALLCWRHEGSARERRLSGGAALAMVAGGLFAALAEATDLPLAGLGAFFTLSVQQAWLATLAYAGLQRTRTGRLA